MEGECNDLNIKMSCLLEKEMGDDFILIYPGQDGNEEYYESLNEVHVSIN